MSYKPIIYNVIYTIKIKLKPIIVLILLGDFYSLLYA